MASLRRFKEKYGHLDVPRDYVDSHCDIDEQQSKPLKLGIAVSNIRRGAAYSDLFFAAQLDRPDLFGKEKEDVAK